MGLDLLDWFRARHPWGKLLRLIAQLPAHSRYKAAIAEDDTYAEALAEALAEQDEPRLTMDGWTPDRALLTALVDAVRQLTAITVAVHSEDGKVPDVPQLPRPVTGIERAREQAEGRRREQAREALLAKLLPHLHS